MDCFRENIFDFFIYLANNFSLSYISGYFFFWLIQIFILSSKAYDPFYESPDTPTQIGTAMLFPKALAYMLPNKGDYKIIDLRNKEAGLLNIEIIPCSTTGKLLVDKDAMIIQNPKTDLIDKSINFILKLNATRNITSIYEDIFCQFQMLTDRTIYKTEVIRSTNNPDFRFTKQFTFTVNQQLLEMILNKPIYIKVFGEQKHPRVDQINTKISTKEYFERDKETGLLSGKLASKVKRYFNNLLFSLIYVKGIK